MLRKTMTVGALIGSLAVAPFVGCESLPGDEKSQGAVIGGVGGALAGAAVAGDDDRLIGALIGGALGAGGGYLIGMEVDKRNDDKDKTREEAIRASQEAERNPATAEAAADAKTADVNSDGFVTLDEVVAMEKAGISDNEMIRRLERTQQYFELTPTQEGFLHERGVSDKVITAMRDINRREADARVASEKESAAGSERIGKTAE